MTGPRRRVTQQDIARIAGVSQTTVSLVLNGRTDTEAKIAAETRDRVLRAIAETGYVADPVARRLAARHNRIFGVVTYEPVFPSANSDFYHPFLVGIEQRAEGLGCDLLLLTSTPVIDGRRRILHPDSRLRLADGCLLLGRTLDRGELAKLVADGPTFVSIGRRDDAGGPVPYVGADYATATAELVRSALRQGHRRLAYLGAGEGSESWTDRYHGFTDGVAGSGAHHTRLNADDTTAVLDSVTEYGATVVFAQEAADGVALYHLARDRGLPLSVATLGEPTRATQPTDATFTGLHIPREEMGIEAVNLLAAMLEGTATETQKLLPCTVVDGDTVVPHAL